MFNLILSKSVQRIRPQEWELILNGAGRALRVSDGLKQSILKRQSLQIFMRGLKPVGIATTDIFPCTFQGIKTVCIFTGNTFIESPYRGRNFIQLYALLTYIKVRCRYPFRKLYWYYASNGYKSYLIMANNFKVFWPSSGATIPPWESAYMEMLNQHFYSHTGSSPIPADHSRSFNRSDTQLNGQDLNPTLRFYLARNPRFAEGEKLPCLGPWTLGNLIPFVLINPFLKLIRIKKSIHGDS